MARSAESLQRRALKRNRSVEEQKTIDSKKAKQVKNQKLVAIAPGAWKCPACATQNFASRYICHAKNCQEPKPESSSSKQKPPSTKVETPKASTKRSPVSSDASASKRQKLEEAVEKVIEWSTPQASASQIEYNKKLRERYINKNSSLTESELERARILVSRDERKRQKKNRTNTSSGNKNAASLPTEPLASKDQHKRNKSLLKKFKKTGGEGMAEEDVVRAKQLLARKERKQQQHTSRQSDKAPKGEEPSPLIDEISEERALKQRDPNDAPIVFADEDVGSHNAADESSDELKRERRKEKKDKKKKKHTKKEKKDRKDDGNSSTAKEDALETAEALVKKSPVDTEEKEKSPKSKKHKKERKAKKESKKEKKD